MLKIIKTIDGDPIDTNYKGVPYQFNLDNVTECNALFGRYNYDELKFLLRYMTEGGVFVDIGANSGLYTQFLTARSPRISHIIAIEPNPRMVARIKKNVSLLQSNDKALGNYVSVEECAVGESVGCGFLGLERGPGEAHVISNPNQYSIPIRIRPLFDILVENNIDHINGLKIDVEGYEDIALIPFFNNAPRTLYPRAIVIEHSSQREWKSNVLHKLYDLGYREIGRTRANALLEFNAET